MPVFSYWYKNYGHREQEHKKTWNSSNFKKIKQKQKYAERMAYLKKRQKEYAQKRRRVMEKVNKRRNKQRKEMADYQEKMRLARKRAALRNEVRKVIQGKKKT